MCNSNLSRNFSARQLNVLGAAIVLILLVGVVVAGYAAIGLFTAAR